MASPHEQPPPQFVAAGFVAIRTPLLPLDEFIAWGGKRFGRSCMERSGPARQINGFSFATQILIGTCACGSTVRPND